MVGGVPTRTGSVAQTTAAPAGGGARRGKAPGDSPLTSATTDSGLGDIILRGRYYLIEESTILPLVALTGRIKFPTADADRGLGTGEFDEGVGVELTKRLADRWLAYLDGGYNFIGDAPDTDFHNQWWYDAGIGYDVTDNLHMSVFYEEYRALVNTVNNARAGEKKQSAHTTFHRIIRELISHTRKGRFQRRGEVATTGKIILSQKATG